MQASCATQGATLLGAANETPMQSHFLIAARAALASRNGSCGATAGKCALRSLIGCRDVCAPAWGKADKLKHSVLCTVLKCSAHASMDESARAIAAGGRG